MIAVAGLAIERTLADVFGGVPDFFIITAAVVTAIGIIWRKVVVPVRGFVRRFKAWMEHTEQALEWVDSQMRPNSGGSLVDKVDNQGDQLVALAHKFDVLQSDVELLLEHDAERDADGFRYGKNDNEKGTS